MSELDELRSENRLLSARCTALENTLWTALTWLNAERPDERAVREAREAIRDMGRRIFDAELAVRQAETGGRR